MSTGVRAIHRAHLEFLSQYDGVLPDEQLSAVWAKVIGEIGQDNCSVLYVMGLAGYAVMLELGITSDDGSPVIVNVHGGGGESIVEDSIKVEPFDLMDETAAKAYFADLFYATPLQSSLDDIWASVGDLHPSEKIDAAIQVAVDHLDADTELGASEQVDDGELAAKVNKADRRREAKKRSKARKKWSGKLETALANPELDTLSPEQRQIFTAVRDLFRELQHQVSTECLLDALFESDFNADAASDRIFTNLSSPTSESSGDKEHSKEGPFTKMKKDKLHGTSPIPSPTVKEGEKVEPVFYSYFLLDHYLAKLRHNNRGIILNGASGCIEFGGMEMGDIATRQCTGTVNNTGGLVVKIDLHGLTSRPCWEVVMSSLEYYRNVLRVASTRCTTDGKTKNRLTLTVRDTRWRDFKYVQVLYVVGRGVHSSSKRPVLRRMVLQVLGEFTFPIEVHPFKENDGEIQIVLKA
jgi:hypothetical protein